MTPYLVLKQILDIIIALIALILLSPIFIFVLIFLLFANKGKPFFFQNRPGKNEKLFKIIKFKTMNDNTDENGELLPFKDRVTNVGLFIRKYSLDEIPQLINVLKGDMSIIGPRPLLVSYLPLYNKEQRKRHSIKPGVTGWAQVNGRNAISWEEKFKLDVWYVQNISFKTDIKIILMTIKKVIKKEDINSSGKVNMEAFKGNTQVQ
ncbi:sugar transferase [Algibacter pectinivorans]|uniref:Sugar transferase involved in LPS biosynthesis (Colanic, teichoic acid) n=1 Tax=Algibacter pectinivorans TaxID=870482 RepID=A0A1I1PN54_9FLAO|nr:sugar transferase [Algibacter pectinivorans]SFD07450.1 Sugar transferase involved in LPS biosynthesis (colanic, teichoic acid) [Algibacter pectinivorans]